MIPVVKVLYQLHSPEDQETKSLWLVECDAHFFIGTLFNIKILINELKRSTAQWPSEIRHLNGMLVGYLPILKK